VRSPGRATKPLVPASAPSGNVLPKVNFVRSSAAEPTVTQSFLDETVVSISTLVCHLPVSTFAMA
jgi:hypothetical protein